ncbi:MAG TPA: hypothetical protein VJV22_03140 [Acidobacteriaceae bacterium]|nr:hypothetical protein [Acidobacteriaceae bacterium]
MPQPAELIDNLIWGIRYGLAMAGAFVVMTTIGRVFGGAELYRRMDTTYLAVVACELCAGLAGGAVIGALRKMLTCTRNAAIVGFLAAAPVGVVLRVGAFGFRPWRRADTIVVLLYAAFMGLTVGPLLWFKYLDVQERRQKGRSHGPDGG